MTTGNFTSGKRSVVARYFPPSPQELMKNSHFAIRSFNLAFHLINFRRKLLSRTAAISYARKINRSPLGSLSVAESSANMLSRISKFARNIRKILLVTVVLKMCFAEKLSFLEHIFDLSMSINFRQYSRERKKILLRVSSKYCEICVNHQKRKRELIHQRATCCEL